MDYQSWSSPHISADLYAGMWIENRSEAPPGSAVYLHWNDGIGNIEYAGVVAARPTGHSSVVYAQGDFVLKQTKAASL